MGPEAELAERSAIAVRVIAGIIAQNELLPSPNVAPEPAQRLGEERPAVPEGVATLADHQLVVVAVVGERRCHLSIRQRPVTEDQVEVLIA
jgi:hypothetical protein